jgi:hypothetical protein
MKKLLQVLWSGRKEEKALHWLNGNDLSSQRILGIGV